MNESKLARVRALLAKAENTDFPAEAETYREKAYALIAEYGIDEALAFAEGKTRDEIGKAEIWIENPYGRDKVALCASVYQPLGLRVVYFNSARDGKPGYKVVAVGYQSDLERAEILYTSLLVQAFRELNYAPKGQVAARSTSNRKTFLVGFSYVIRQRLIEAAACAAERVHEVSTGVSTALVLVDRKTAVAQAFTEAFPHTKKVSRKLSGNGYAAGKEAGARADLGNKRVGGNRRALQG